MTLKIKLAIFFVLISLFAQAQDLPQEVLQGSLVISKDTKVDQVIKDGQNIKLSKDGYFVFAVGRDRIDPISIKKLLKDKVVSIDEIKIIKQDYEIQRIDGLPEQMVTPLEDEIIERIIAENKAIKEKKLVITDNTFFVNQFIIPAQGIISGVFGSQRILNGKEKSPHRGLDIAAAEGEPVIATNDGIVILAEEDLYYTGGTIMIEHGHGVKSIYAHMSSLDVKVNDIVLKSQRIGSVGSTGRSTGPHLHWGVMLLNTYVDPALLIVN
tara:strand:+ start:285 stop:1088 length:804 start_codon:yes stop_codon:yes gene_type:complete